MTISTVIVNWNTRQLLGKCLRSLYSDAHLENCEVWVVDNASTDGSSHFVQADFPQVHLIENPANMGFARANNLAIRASSGGKVLLLNPDTEVEHGAIHALAGFMDAHPGAGAVGPMLINSGGALQISTSQAPSLMGEFVSMFHLADEFAPEANLDESDLIRASEVDVLQGACLMLRRSALDEVGLLDEDYFMYSEEVDLCRRLRQAGWTIHWLPEARVIHHGGQSAQQVPMESFLHLYRGKVTYFRKQHGMATAFAYKAILAAASLARLILTPFALLGHSEGRSRHLDLARRYGRLLIQMPGM